MGQLRVPGRGRGAGDGFSLLVRHVESMQLRCRPRSLDPQKDERPDIPVTAARLRSEENKPLNSVVVSPLSDGRHRSIQRSAHAHRDGIEPRTREEARVTVTLLAMSVKAAHLRSEENKEQSK